MVPSRVGHAAALLLVALLALGLPAMLPPGALANGSVGEQSSDPVEIFSKDEVSSRKGRQGGISVGQAIARVGKDVLKKANTAVSDASLGNMAQDETAFVDEHGKIFFVDHMVDEEESAGHAKEWLRHSLEVGGDEAANRLEFDASAFCAGISEVDLLLLESRPSSTKLVILDFTGHRVEGTNNPWTKSDGATGDYTVAPWNLALATEREKACLVWHVVAKVYSFSDINVTTNEGLLPFEDYKNSAGQKRSALERETSDDPLYGVRSIMHRDNTSPPFLSGMPNEADGCGCRGIAYLSVFGDVGTTSTSGYREHHVRYNYNDYNEAVTAAACTHEIGHNVGLNHDGGKRGDAYYNGHKIGDFVGEEDAASLSKLVWAPIMGRGLWYSHLGQFAQEYTSGKVTNSNSREDDFAQMALNRVLADPDTDESDTIAGAAAKTVGQDVAAVIGSRADVDVFRFDLNLAGTACEGGVTSCKFTATVEASRSNFGVHNDEIRGAGSTLNVGLEILNGAGDVLGVGLTNPGANSAIERFLGATVTADVFPANGIYVRVAGYGYQEPVGFFRDDSSAPIDRRADMEGFLSYGSVGSYLLRTSTSTPCAKVCANGGTCVESEGTESCACAAGFTGDTCETNVDDCASNPCSNNGVCQDGVNAYTCACTADYSGQTCTDPVCTKVCGTGETCVEGGEGTDTCETATFTCNDDCTLYNDRAGCKSVCDPTGSGLYCTYNKYGGGKNQYFLCEKTDPNDPAWPL